MPTKCWPRGTSVISRWLSEAIPPDTEPERNRIPEGFQTKQVTSVP